MIGDEYRHMLQDGRGRQVWLNSERVPDVLSHLMFKPIVDVPARMAYEEVYRDVMAYRHGSYEVPQLPLH